VLGVLGVLGLVAPHELEEDVLEGRPLALHQGDSEARRAEQWDEAHGGDLGILDVDPEAMAIDLHSTGPGLASECLDEQSRAGILAGIDLDAVGRWRKAVEQLRDPSGDDEPAAIEDRDLLADPLNVRQDVTRQHDRRGLAQPPDQRQQIAAAFRIERRHRLIEDQELGTAEDGLADPQPLAHPRRVGPDLAIGGLLETDPLERLVGSISKLGAGQPEEVADEAEELPPRHPAVVARLLVEDPDAPVQLGLHAPAASRVEPRDADAARGGGGDAGQEADRRRLAGAIGTEEPEDDSRRDIEIEPVQCEDGAVALGQAVGGDREGTVGTAGVGACRAGVRARPGFGRGRHGPASLGHSASRPTKK